MENTESPRTSTPSNTVKEVIVETDYKNCVYEMKVQSLDNDTINILLNFPTKMYGDIKDDDLKIVSSNDSLIKHIQKNMAINGLAKGNYKLLLNNSILVKFGIK